MDLMDIMMAKAISGGGGGGGGTSEDNYDLVLTELVGETDSTFTLKGLSFDEIEAAITQTNDMHRAKYISSGESGEGPKTIQETTRLDYDDDANHTEITYSFSANTDDKLIQMVKEGNLLGVVIFGDVFTATYDSTTKEYTLTPYTP